MVAPIIEGVIDALSAKVQVGDASTARLIAQLHALTTAMKEFSGARSTRENQRILDVLTLAVAHEQIGVADMMRCTGLSKKNSSIWY